MTDMAIYYSAFTPVQPFSFLESKNFTREVRTTLCYFKDMVGDEYLVSTQQFSSQEERRGFFKPRAIPCLERCVSVGVAFGGGYLCVTSKYCTK